jgi:hypothetical protein
MPNLTAQQMLARLPVRMAEGGAVDTAPGVSAAYRKAMQAGGQQTVNDYYANLRKDAEAYLANPDAPRGVEAYNVLLQSGISTSDLINAGVGQAVLDKIFAVDKFIPQSQFVTPTGMTSAYERSPDLAFESQRLTAQGQDGRAILDKQGRDYIANLQQGGIDAAERAQMLEYATERGYSFDDLRKAGVDPNVLFNVVVPPMPGSALAPPVFPQTQPTYIPPTVYQPLPTQPDIFAAGQPALDTAFRESSPRTAIPGMPGQFDYSPAAKLRPATGAGFTFTPPSVTSRPRSLLSPREIQAYGGMTSKSQQFAANRAAIDRSLRRLQAASPALSNPSAYALLRNRIMAQDFGNPQRVFDPKTGEVNLTTEEGQSFLKAVNALAAASPAEKAAAEKAVKTDATVGTGATDVDQTDSSVIRGGSTTQPGGYAAAIDGGDKITYGGYDILQQAKGGLVKKSNGSAKDELARFANGGEADAELLRRQLENIDNTPTARTPEREPTPEQTESRTMLENLRSGFAQIPQTVMGYGRDVLQSEAPLAKVGADVSALGSGAVEGLKQDPAGFILDMLPVVGEIRSGRDAAKYSDLANEARAANDLDAAAMYEQMSTLAAAGATPLIGTAGRLGRRIAGAPDEAMMRMAGSNTPTAADDLAALTERAPTTSSIAARSANVVTALNKSGDPLGINVAVDPRNGTDYADLIVSGAKKFESRETASLKPYVGKRVGIVRTGAGQAEVIGSVEIGQPIKVNEKQFNQLRDQHLVAEDSSFNIKKGQTKFLYPMIDPTSTPPQKVTSKGIVARAIPTGQRAADDLAELTAKAQTETPEFKSWFGNSAITRSLEPNGKPRRLYHITPKNFDAFDVNQPDAVDPSGSKSGPVIFMSDEAEDQPAAHNVGGFKGKFKEGANVMPLYASIQNPLFIDYTSKAAERARFNLGRGWPYIYTQEDVSKLQAAGYDGVFLVADDGPNEIVAFRPEQVKSAIGNEGTFDPANPVITKAKGGAVTKNNVERMRNDNRKYL